MLALCSMLSCTYYTHFNAGIIGAALVAGANWEAHDKTVESELSLYCVWLLMLIQDETESLL